MLRTAKKQFTLTAIILLGLFASCAKKQEDQLPDNFERDFHSKSLFTQEITLKTVGSETQALTVQGLESSVLALNEKGLFPVEMVSGPAVLKPMFEGLKIHASNAGETFKISFKLTKDRIIAYIDLSNKKLSAFEKELSINNKTALFEYTGVSYGYLERDRDDYGEDTRNIQFIDSDRHAATHLKVTILPDRRELVGLRGFHQENILLTDILERKEWALEQIGNLYRLDMSAQTQEFKSTPVKVKAIDNTLYVQTPSTLGNLNNIEFLALKNKDPRIEKCDRKTITQDDLKNKELCVLRPIYVADIIKTRLKLDKDSEGETLGSVSLAPLFNNEKSPFSYISANAGFASFDFDTQIASLKNKDVFTIERFDDKDWESKELASLLRIKDVEKVKAAHTKLINGIVWVLVPTKLSDLHPIEQAALGNDPRYKECSAKVLELTGLTKDNCVMKPAYRRSATYSQLTFEYQPGTDHPSISLQVGVEPSLAQFIKVQVDQKPMAFNYMEDIKVTDEVITNKSLDFDIEGLYLYVPMTHGTPREVAVMDPFYQGNEKLVKIKFSEEGLDVFEIEKDARFSDNPLNDAPIMTIPGRHVDYRCQTDDNGDCLTGVVENRDITWSDKRFFIPTLENLKLDEVNQLDLYTGDMSCLQQTGVRLVDYEIKKGVINIELEKTFKVVGMRCIIPRFYSNQAEIKFGFKTRFNYSLVKRDKLISKDYKPLVEVDTFRDRFFKTTTYILDGTLDQRRQKEVNYVNRWNPERKTIDYHLSDSFNKPENKIIKEETYKAIGTINDSLARAGARFRIELKEPSSKKVGDLRYSMINLIDDPLANGLLGYGPSVADPLTGEIVQAHTNMYGGVLKSMTRRVYENMVDFSIDLKNAKIKGVTFDETPKESASEETNEKKSSLEKLVSEYNKAKMKHNFSLALQKKEKVEKLKPQVSALPPVAHKKENVALNRLYTGLKHDTVARVNSGEDLTSIKEDLEYQKRIERIIENNGIPAEVFEAGVNNKDFIDGILDIKGILNKDGTLKRWTELNDTQKEVVTNLILPHTYRSTFVHELGHNLGLRHNFTGSFDKKNFYTEEEARALGLNKVPQYSSIMDYAFSELNELPVYGKYDVAALAYAYNNPQDPQVIQTLETMAFCTDGNAGTNASCNRFDEGSSYKDIAEHYKKRYLDAYKYRNFRDDRPDFTVYDTFTYLRYRMMDFRRMRSIFEQWERLKEFTPKVFPQLSEEEQLKIAATGCDETQAQTPNGGWFCPMIKDAIDGTIIAGETLLDIAKTPDQTCLMESKQNKRLSIIPLKVIQEDYMRLDKAPYTCFDPEVVNFLDRNNYTIVGERGKYTNDIGEYGPFGVYSSDIGVQGTWVDRVLAANMLTTRLSFLTSTEDGLSSYLEHPVLGEKVKKFFMEMASGKVISEGHKFVDQTGKELADDKQIPYSLDYDDTYLVPEQAHPYVALSLGLPMFDGSYLNKEMLKMAYYGASASDPRVVDDAKAFQKSISVVRMKDTLSFASGLYSATVHIDNYVYAARKENIVAYELMKGMEFIRSLRPDDYLLLSPKEQKLADQEIKKVLSSAYFQRTNAQRDLPERGASVDASLSPITLAQKFFNQEVYPKTLEASELSENQIKATQLTDEQIDIVYDVMDVEAVEKTLLAVLPKSDWVPSKTEEDFINEFGDELGPKLYNAYMLGPEGLGQVVTLKKILSAQAQGLIVHVSLLTEVDEAITADQDFDKDELVKKYGAQNAEMMMTLSQNSEIAFNILYSVAKKIAATTIGHANLDMLDTLRGQPVPKAVFYQQLPEEVAGRFWAAFNATDEELQVARDILTDSVKMPAGFAYPELFEMSEEQLVDLLNGQADKYEEILQLLPAI